MKYLIFSYGLSYYVIWVANNAHKRGSDVLCFTWEIVKLEKAEISPQKLRNNLLPMIRSRSYRFWCVGKAKAQKGR